MRGRFERVFRVYLTCSGPFTPYLLFLAEDDNHKNTLWCPDVTVGTGSETENLCRGMKGFSLEQEASF